MQHFLLSDGTISKKIINRRYFLKIVFPGEIPLQSICHAIIYDFKSPLVECANKLAQILWISNNSGGDGKMMMQHSLRVETARGLEPYTLVMEHLNLWP